jgi:hypothetical protein
MRYAPGFGSRKLFNFSFESGNIFATILWDDGLTKITRNGQVYLTGRKKRSLGRYVQHMRKYHIRGRIPTLKGARRLKEDHIASQWDISERTKSRRS